MTLVFEDGKTVTGRSFGFPKNVAGEVVFSTGMVGYPLSLTDPSYRGQILVLTYPLQGNYGVFAGPFESERIQVQGLIVSHYTDNPSHFKCHQTLAQWLSSQEIPALCDVDTRSLTQYLRERGSLPAKLFANEQTQDIEHVDFTNLLNIVAASPPALYGNGQITILLIDTGCKYNIIRSLLLYGVRVLRVSWQETWEKYLPEVDGILLPNGPGDPRNVGDLVHRIRALFTLEIPIFGICLGHQLISLAAGFTTQKMKYGHRSFNQPVRNLLTGRCYITSQNHGYVVNATPCPADWLLWFENVNDGTNEGIYHKHKFIRSVQFHPEACPGPQDTIFLFEEFVQAVVVSKKQKATPYLNAVNAQELNNNYGD